MPMDFDMNDVGYARGGPGIDSGGLHQCESSMDGGFLGIQAAQVGGSGEWHFHIFGETLGLYAMDVRQGSAGLQVIKHKLGMTFRRTGARARCRYTRQRNNSRHSIQYCKSTPLSYTSSLELRYCS